MWDRIVVFVPSILTFLIVVLILFVLVRFILGPRFGLLAESRFRRQVTVFVAALIGIVAVILTLPISATLRAQLIAFLGLVLSAAIALSSTTFIGNVMAGFMIRAVGHFRPGDFVLVGEHFGRVSEQGLFTTEVQTQDRDLTTFPNLFLVTNPMTVVRSSGAIVSATVSLGYDIAHSIVERVLAQAVEKAELAEPFVQILELGSYSVNYRVGGFLSDVKTLLTARSRLRASILDTLHENNIEIVSPTFMNQRVLPASRTFIPEKEAAPQRPAVPGPEQVAFDKAEQAEAFSRLQVEHEQLSEEIEKRKKLKGEAQTDEERARLEAEIARLTSRRDWIAGQIEAANSNEGRK